MKTGQMPSDYYAPYRDYLRPEARIEIGIPLSGGGIFRDWAIISESAEDELVAQISRDVLPANVRVEIGFILDVSIWIHNETYTCSGIITEKRGTRVLGLRLFGPFTLRERRQFFRIKTDLRLRYAFIDDGNRRDIERDWAHRRDLEHMKFQGYDQYAIAAHKGRHTPAVELEWHDMFRSQVNLSGGGIYFVLPEPVHPDELLALEIHLPQTPPRQVQAVVQVIHVKMPKARSSTSDFRAGMGFLFLDERDRDLLFRHISVTQIGLLRTIADRREFPEKEQLMDGGAVSGESVSWQQVVWRAVMALLCLILVFYLVSYLIRYKEQGSPNEIQDTYKKSIEQYRLKER